MVHGKNRISYRIDRRLTGLADLNMMLPSRSGCSLSLKTRPGREHAMEGSGATLHHREGGPNSGWRLLDFGDVIVHIFGAEERDYYRIEGAWPEAVEVVRIQ